MPKSEKSKHAGKPEDMARPAPATVKQDGGGIKYTTSARRTRTEDSSAAEAGKPRSQAAARSAKQPVMPRKRNANTRSSKMAENQGDQSEQQRELAYYLWQQAGSPEGRQDEFWHLAGHQLAQDDLAADAAIDAAEEDSFPASDPVNHT